MRWTAFSWLIVCGCLLAGCDGGSGATTAGAGGAGAPPPPGSAPAGPPAPGDAAPPNEGAPADGVQPSGSEGTPAPQPGDAPPPEGTPAPGSPDGAAPPGDSPNNNPDNPDGDNPDGTPRRPPPPRNLREQAIAAFRGGNDILGFKLLNAHYAAAPAAKNDLPQKMGWVPGLMRPSLAPRIGMAVVYLDIPLNFKSSPMPVGSSALTSAVDAMQQAEAKDRKIGGTGRKSRFTRGATGPTENFSENSKGDPMANASAPVQLNYYLGEYGQWLLEALHERMESGEYGPVMRELSQQARPLRRASPGGPDGQPGEGDPGSDASPDGGGPGGGFPGPGGRGGGQFGGRGGGRGQFGGGQSGGSLDGIPGSGGSGGAAPRRWSTRSADKERANLAQVRQLMPCITWLGKVKDDERDELHKRAEAAGVEILAVFEMTLKEARSSSFINNKTTLKITNLRLGKPLAGYSPEPLVNLAVEQWRQKDEKGLDPVEREVTKAIEALDKALKPVPLPEAVTAERAKKRIADLVAAKPDEPLPVIVEARYYMSKGLMTEDEVNEAAKALLGEDGFARLAARAAKDGE